MRIGDAAKVMTREQYRDPTRELRAEVKRLRDEVASWEGGHMAGADYVEETLRVLGVTTLCIESGRLITYGHGPGFPRSHSSLHELLLEAKR